MEKALQELNKINRKILDLRREYASAGEKMVRIYLCALAGMFFSLVFLQLHFGFVYELWFLWFVLCMVGLHP